MSSHDDMPDLQVAAHIDEDIPHPWDVSELLADANEEAVRRHYWQNGYRRAVQVLTIFLAIHGYHPQSEAWVNDYRVRMQPTDPSWPVKD